MKSNCYIQAWRAYASGDAVWMACRKSKWSRFPTIAAPLRWIGTILVWSATGIWLAGHFLRFGTWPHWVFCNRLGGDCREYMPVEAKSAKAFPPLMFKGQTQDVNDD